MIMWIIKVVNHVIQLALNVLDLIILIVKANVPRAISNLLNQIQLV